MNRRFNELINAIRKSVEIEIEYDKYTTPDSRRVRRVQPYALREFRNRWYLLAAEVSASNQAGNNLKIWGLDRIRKLTHTNRTFQKDTTFDMKTIFEHCFGIYANKEILSSALHKG
ncbi:WYL domain-containing protein [Bacteroides sp. 224]|uniref:WYL domain-containing protein n=1 Tax=Bacteroides sp. 224 TaxID=2302936 RepID=UPI0013D2A40A|nr:WYL domain-containing protein [Bacteroides sp. 224]NDV65671.1 WYL domain-containing protein [Bacteroides sp. 224]